MSVSRSKSIKTTTYGYILETHLKLSVARERIVITIWAA